MKLLYYSILLFTFFGNAQQQQPTLDYYLPQNVTYNKSIPTPKSVLNFELEKCTDHTQVALYMKRSSKSV
jgi:hypothetical protein